MALTGDRLVGSFQGHALEWIRSNFTKTVKLLIDGVEVAGESCMFPGRIELKGALVHNGVSHAVVARSIPKWLIFTTETIAVDGREVPLVRKK